MDKILSEAGVASRKELKQMIKLGRVQVDGRTALSPEQKYDEATAQILVDGALIAARRAIVLMLNKPAGVVSSTEDPRDKTVLDCLPAEYQAQGLFPVGRLDKETEGLLLLTNDENGPPPYISAPPCAKNLLCQTRGNSLARGRSGVLEGTAAERRHTVPPGRAYASGTGRESDHAGRGKVPSGAQNDGVSAYDGDLFETNTNRIAYPG